MPACPRRSSSPGCATSSRSGISRHGGANSVRLKGAWRMLPNASHSNSSAMAHVPVLAAEVSELLELRPGDTVVDCTFGAGGHAALLEPQLGGSGVYIAVDRDPEAHRHYDVFAASAT